MDRLEYAIRELYYWQKGKGEGSNFHSQLYNLFQKADPQNRMRLQAGFPEENTALSLWYMAGNYGDDLFKEYSYLFKEEENEKPTF